MVRGQCTLCVGPREQSERCFLGEELKQTPEAVDPKQEEDEEAGYQPERHGGVQTERVKLKQMVNLTRTSLLGQ